MSIVDFLNSVYDRVVDVFETWWAATYFTLYLAYTVLYDFVYNLYQSLVHFKYSLRAVLDAYVVYIHTHALVILSYSWDITHFVVIQSYGMIYSLYYTWSVILNVLAGSMWGRVTFVFQSAWNVLAYLLSIATTTWNFILTTVKDMAQRFINQYEVFIISLLFYKDYLFELVSSSVFGKLISLANDLYSAIRTLAIDYFVSIVSLVGRVVQILALTELVIFQRIVSIFTTSYNALVTLISWVPILATLITGQALAKLLFLVQDGYALLLSFYNSPADTILGFIRGKFLPWLGNLLYEWLLSPIEE
jgi:hypothetical protein